MPISVRVRDAMDKNIVYVDEDKTCMDAINSMLENKVWSVVVTRDELPVGVVTERDIIRRVLSKNMNVDKAKLGEIMSSPLITIAPDEPISRAMEIMAINDIRRVYVVEKGKIIGRITQTEAFRYLLNVLLAISNLTWNL